MRCGTTRRFREARRRDCFSPFAPSYSVGLLVMAIPCGSWDQLVRSGDATNLTLPGAGHALRLGSACSDVAHVASSSGTAFALSCSSIIRPTTVGDVRVAGLARVRAR